MKPNIFSCIFPKKVSMYKFNNKLLSLFTRETVRSVASITDGATGRQDGYLISSVSENSNVLSVYGYTLDTIAPRISQLR